MKKSEIQDALDALQKAGRRLNKKIADLARATNDAAQFQAELEAIGEPDYRNEAAITKQVVLERKLKGARAVIERFESEARDEGSEFFAVVTRCGNTAGELLSEIYGRRIETITSCIAPFYRDEHRAKQAAVQTDSAQMAYVRIKQLQGLALRNPVQDPITSLDAAMEIHADVESILVEALKKAPDLMRFFHHAAPIAAPVEAQEPADGETGTEGAQ